MSVNSKMTAIADEIRELSGTTETMGLDAMASNLGEANNEVDSQAELLSQIATALEGKAVGSEQATPVISVNSSGLITATAGDKSATKQLTTQAAKTITPSTSSQTAVAKDVYTTGVVTVAAIPSNYVVPTGTLNITANGTYDVKNYATATVNVEGSGGGGNSSTEDALLMGTVSGEYSNNRVTSIAAYAFSECTNLTSVDLPNVTLIKDYAFNKCSNLANVSIPSLVTMNQRAFYFCTKIAKLDLPNLTSMAQYALAQCQYLVTLILRSETVCTLANTNALTNTPIAKATTGYIYVPSALVESYKSATNWSTYASQIRAIEDYPDICGV
jgi:hypothetical protein